MSWVNPICISLLALGLAGCASLPSSEDKAPEKFQLYWKDARVWHEAGGEAQAARVAGLLDAAVARVESVHGLPFRRPPRVHVCISAACFQRLVATADYSAAVLPGDVLVLSPNLFGREAARLPAILTHELSHLHLGQRLGHYTPWLPVWFHEGLASLAARGGGAEFASDREAYGAWDEGRQVDFALMDIPGKRHRAGDFGLSIHEFYRQSWRFMEYLRNRDMAAFGTMLTAIQAKTDITISVADAYNAGLERLERDFIDASPYRGDDKNGG
jgi:hypothetical protein